jgi:flagellar biosynthesis GTPase FlhF
MKIQIIKKLLKKIKKKINIEHIVIACLSIYLLYLFQNKMIENLDMEEVMLPDKNVKMLIDRYENTLKYDPKRRDKMFWSMSLSLIVGGCMTQKGTKICISENGKQMLIEFRDRIKKAEEKKQAEEEAIKKAAEKKKAEEEAKKKAEEEAKKKAEEAEEEAKKKAEEEVEEAKKKAEEEVEEAKKKAEEEVEEAKKKEEAEEEEAEEEEEAKKKAIFIGIFLVVLVVGGVIVIKRRSRS